jgi:hypothetical protein
MPEQNTNKTKKQLLSELEALHKKNAELNIIAGNQQTEETIKEHLLFQELISKISAKFTGLYGVEFEQAIQDSLAKIGKYFRADTVRLYRLSLQGDVVKIRNTWRNEHLAPPQEMAQIHELKYPNLARLNYSFRVISLIYFG